MLSGVSNCDLALILVDARKGLLTQTKRHIYLCNLMGVNKLLLIINKVDLVNYDQDNILKIFENYKTYAQSLNIKYLDYIPISALTGENLFEKSKKLIWYRGTSLFEYLENFKPFIEKVNEKFYFPVQYVNAHTQDFRGYSGRIESGKIKLGDKIKINPGTSSTNIKKIYNSETSIKSAKKGDIVTLEFKDNLECSRAKIITNDSNNINVSDHLRCLVVWMDNNPLILGRSYWVKLSKKIISAEITLIKHKVDIESHNKIATTELHINEIGVINLKLDEKVAFTSFKENKNIGSFILIDKFTNFTSGFGMIYYGLNRSENVKWYKTTISCNQRSIIKNQLPKVIWFTGLSGSGKSTIANILEHKLILKNKHTYLLDGDNIRHGLNKNLGFSNVDRIENIRRIGEVAKLMVDAGLIVIVATISPYKSDRETIRKLFAKNQFFEVFISTPLSVCEKRDVKGLYKKARQGVLKNFTGISSSYEEPDNPDLIIKTEKVSAEKAANKIIKIFFS